LSGYSEEHFSISKTEVNNKSHIKLYISPTVKSTLTLPKHYIQHTLRDFLKVMYLHECTYTTCVSGGDVSSGSRVPRVCVCVCVFPQSFYLWSPISVVLQIRDAAPGRVHTAPLENIS